MTEEPKRNSVRATVLEQLTSKPGQVLYVGELASDTGFTERQVASTIYNARRTNDTLAREIEVIMHGNAWRYRPTPLAGNGVVDAPARPSKSKPAERHEKSTTRRDGLPDERRTGALDRRIFEEVSRLANGEFVVIDEDGKLYRAQELT